MSDTLEIVHVTAITLLGIMSMTTLAGAELLHRSETRKPDFKIATHTHPVVAQHGLLLTLAILTGGIAVVYGGLFLTLRWHFG